MSIQCPDCGATWTGLRMEHCAVCHQTFIGTRAGDMHRTGEHGVPDGPDARRCRTPEEMQAYFYSRRGEERFWQDDRGTWHYGQRRPAESLPGGAE